MKNTLLIRLLRQALLQAPWAQARLKPFAGAVIRWDIAGVQGEASIDPEGLLYVGGESALGVHLFLAPDRLHVLSQGMDALMREVRIEGNAGLASELAFIAKNLKPDIAEFLAPHMGDVMAEAIGSHVHQVIDALPRVSQTLAGTASDYLVHEANLLVDAAEGEIFYQGVDRLRDDLERLEQRVARLEARTRMA